MALLSFLITETKMVDAHSCSVIETNKVNIWVVFLNICVFVYVQGIFYGNSAN